MRPFAFCVCLIAFFSLALPAQERTVAGIQRSQTVSTREDASPGNHSVASPSISRNTRALTGAIIGVTLGLYFGYKYAQDEANCGGDVACPDHTIRDAILGGMFGGVIGAALLADKAGLPSTTRNAGFRPGSKRLAIFHSTRF